MIVSARGVWIAYRRGGGLLLTLLFLFLIVSLVFLALRVEGSFYVNGRPVTLDTDTRIDFAVGLGLRGVNILAMLFLLFHGGRLLFGDAERGSAAFDLTAPISRTGYLAGRAAGLLSVVLLVWALSIALIGGLVFRRFGLLLGDLLPAALLFLLGNLVLAGLVALFRLLLGGGWGATAAVLLLGGSWFLSLDMVEAYLFDIPLPKGGGSWWGPFLGPYLAGEPAGATAALARLACRFFPPLGNLQGLGVDTALGRDVFPSSDWRAVPVGAAWALLLWAAAFQIFRRREW